MNNVDSSMTLDWQMWGGFSGRQYAYTEGGTFYRQWWLARQEELLFVVYSSDSQDDSETEVINGIVDSLAAVDLSPESGEGLSLPAVSARRQNSTSSALLPSAARPSSALRGSARERF
jgi:hypothetical protein